MRESPGGEPASGPFEVRAVAAGTTAALALGAGLAALTALAIYFTALSEPYLSLGLYYAGFVVVLAGGAVAARRARRLGWLHGGMAGMSAACLAFVALALLFPGSLLPGEVARQAGLAFLAGAVGGILGVNL